MGNLQKILRDPVFHFVLLGAAVFGLHRAVAPAPQSRIVVTEALQEGLRADFSKQHGRQPDSEELTGLVSAWVDDEILYRRGLELDLQRGDPVLRRRLVQAMRFVLEEGIGEPTDAQLQAIVEASPDSFTAPGRVDLEHVFFARDATTDAARVLQRLQDNPEDPEARSAGRPFIHGRSLVAQSAAQLDRTFGPGFSAKVDALTVGDWSGPLTSSYGLHLVRVLNRTPANQLTLQRARPQATAVWKDRERKERVEKALSQLKDRYDVTVQ